MSKKSTPIVLQIKPRIFPDLSFSWNLLPDPDRFDQFWFYDAGVTTIVSVATTKGIYSVSLINARTLQVQAWDRYLNNRYAVRTARAMDLHDKDIIAYRKNNLLEEDGYLLVTNSRDDREFVVKGPSVLDALKTIEEDVNEQKI